MGKRRYQTTLKIVLFCASTLLCIYGISGMVYMVYGVMNDEPLSKVNLNSGEDIVYVIYIFCFCFNILCFISIGSICIKKIILLLQKKEPKGNRNVTLRKRGSLLKRNKFLRDTMSIMAVMVCSCMIIFDLFNWFAFYTTLLSGAKYALLPHCSYISIISIGAVLFLCVEFINRLTNNRN